MWIVLVVILAVFSYMDVRERAISVRMLVVCILFSVFFAIGELWIQSKEEGYVWQQCLAVMTGRMLPGLLLILLAFASKGKIGYGDGMVLIIIGNIMGVLICLRILTTAVILSFFFSCVQLMFFRKSMSACFPFIPFYLCSTLIIGIVTLGAG